MLDLRCSLIGADVDEIRPRLGYWWVGCSGHQNIAKSEASYIYERMSGCNGRIEVFVKNNKVVAVNGYCRVKPYD